MLRKEFNISKDMTFPQKYVGLENFKIFYNFKKPIYMLLHNIRPEVTIILINVELHNVFLFYITKTQIKQDRPRHSQLISKFEINTCH